MSEKIKLARKIFKEAFEKDEDFRITYQANIAMLLYDRYGINGYKERNAAANDIMGIIFDAKNIKRKKVFKQDISRFEILDL